MPYICVCSYTRIEGTNTFKEPNITVKRLFHKGLNFRQQSLIADNSQTKLPRHPLVQHQASTPVNRSRRRNRIFPLLLVNGLRFQKRCLIVSKCYCECVYCMMTIACLVSGKNINNKRNGAVRFPVSLENK